MKKHHKTHILLILFVTGLFALWWADVGGPPTESESAFVLPALRKPDAKSVRRIVIESPKGTVAFERTEDDDWQMKEPSDVAANSAMVKTLLGNLTKLMPSEQAGKIQDSGDQFGFASPAATIKIFAEDSKTLLTGLEIGAPVQGFKDERYVRPLGEKRIEVVDSRLLSQVELPPIDWREKTLFDVPSFYVARLTVTGPGRELTIQREEAHWEILNPIQAPADDEKVEGIVAELSSLRVADGEKGFVADNAANLAPYGLDKPDMVVTLKQKAESRPDQVMLVGKEVPDKPDHRYAKRANQDDVVMIDAKGLLDLGKKPNAYRSLKIADVTPGKCSFMTFQLSGKTIKLSHGADGWEQLEPLRQKADATTVTNFLQRLSQLYTTEYLDPSQVNEPTLDPPVVAIKVWQFEGNEKPPATAPSEPTGAPRVNLRLGRIDAIRKSIYGQIEGDRSILALPEAFREVVPKNELTFRDRTLLTIGATEFSHLTVVQGKTKYEIQAPNTPGTSLHWQLTEPVTGQADDEQVTKAVLLIGNLRASEFVTLDMGDGKAYGLDEPGLTITWTLHKEAEKGKADSTGTLRIGSPIKGTDLYYANLSGSAMVFKLTSEFVQPFFGEFRDHRVLTFEPSRVQRIVFRWPGRWLSLVPTIEQKGLPPKWHSEFGQDTTGFDVSKINALIEQLAKLQTDHFVQYYGLFTEAYGLTPPRVSVEFQFDGQSKKVLRVGNQSESGPLYATTENSNAGTVFTLSGPAWVELTKAPKRADDLPDQVFQMPAQGQSK